MTPIPPQDLPGDVRAAGRGRAAQPLNGFAVTSVTLMVLPVGVSYSTASPSRAPVSALPSGEAAVESEWSRRLGVD